MRQPDFSFEKSVMGEMGYGTMIARYEDCLLCEYLVAGACGIRGKVVAVHVP